MINNNLLEIKNFIENNKSLSDYNNIKKLLFNINFTKFKFNQTGGFVGEDGEEEETSQNQNTNGESNQQLVINSSINYKSNPPSLAINDKKTVNIYNINVK
jgi:hypothetical protein